MRFPSGKTTKGERHRAWAFFSGCLFQRRESGEDFIRRIPQAVIAPT